MTLAKIKTNFSAVIRDVEGGEEVIVLYGKRKQPVAKIVPFGKNEKQETELEKWKRTAEGTIGRLAHWKVTWNESNDEEDYKEFYDGDIFPTPMVAEGGGDAPSYPQTPKKK